MFGESVEDEVYRPRTAKTLLSDKSDLVLECKVVRR
jgi:hypothetical protein